MEDRVHAAISDGSRLGIMGGTFDPIHYGHLVAAETARTEFRLDNVLFIPTGIPPHKVSRHIADAELRYTMVELAIKDNANFKVSRIEIKRQGPSYTSVTLRELHHIFPEQELFFITGADALKDILTWRDADEIIRTTNIIGATRPGYDASGFLEELYVRFPFAQSKIFQMEIPALAISSTDIHFRLENNKSIRYLLPEEVRSFIMNNNIYRDK
ncbi:nicotinate-nucleotide adenylyltransferase [Dehalobacter sp. DCM]|uniref:nicotinate-nucleotide adenylyltransferase n=1 Tax=Dehalobacter sp. DCM TaxID=2907827 RepID=UPI003081B1D9|nr:nicotinate-nucleotide adenylyltransferase [Dehalobacter sp. DCM]